MTRTGALLLALTVLFAATLGPPANSAEVVANPKEYASWWVERFGTSKLSRSDKRATTMVFDRLRAAAGRPGVRLEVVERSPDPIAVALRDAVVINSKLVHECRRLGGENWESLLAFVLAHELSHNVTGDMRVFAAFGETPALRQLGVAEVSKREIAADARGLLLTIEAGFDHLVVLNAVKAGFIQALERDAGFGVQREHLLPAEFEDLTLRVEEYRFGVRLVTLGRLEDGLLLMGPVLEVYQGREVLNDAAVATLRIAARVLAGCDGRLVARFRLPTIIDGATLEDRTRLRGSTRSPCLDDRRFSEPIGRAIELLEKAVASDPAYLPARLNLAHAHLLAGRYADAVGPAHEALELAPTDAYAQVVHAVAMHAFGHEAGWPDATDSALERLSKIDAQETTALVAWNRAAIEAERGRTTAAEASWRHALELEPRGEWADIARERLGQEPAVAAAPPKVNKPALVPPIALGKLGPAHAKLWARELKARALRGSMLSASATRSTAPARALALHGSVELVESAPPPGVTLKKLEAKLGEPQRVEATARGSLFTWPGLLVEEIDGRITAMVWSTATPATR